MGLLSVATCCPQKICIPNRLVRSANLHPTQRKPSPVQDLVRGTQLLHLQDNKKNEHHHFLLKTNELAQIFAGSEIWLDDVEYLDDGRPVSAFICRYE